jgi:hypothetical protein
MKKACLVLTFAALAAGSATAATPASTPPLMDRWDAGLVSAALTSLGVTGIRDASIDGQPGLLARTPDGLSMGVYAKACTPSPSGGAPVCRGLESLMGYEPGAPGDHSLLIDRLNHDFAPGKFTVERDGTIRLTQYVNLKGGISQANLKADLADFLTVAAGAKPTIWATPAR